MFFVSTLSEIENQLALSCDNSAINVGIMLANYKTNLVRDVISNYFESWHIESGNSFNIFWPGYNLPKANPYIPDSKPMANNDILVNFNPSIAANEMSQIIEQSKPRKFIKGSHYIIETNNVESLKTRYNNPNGLYFRESEYLNAKSIARKNLKLNYDNKIDSLTLVITRYKNGKLSFGNNDSIVVNLRELSKDDDAVTKVNELMSEINMSCKTDVSFSKLKRAIKVISQEKRMSNWQTNISLLIDIISTAIGFVTPKL